MRRMQLFPCLAFAACASASSTPQELGEGLIGAARTGDLAAFERLYWSPFASAEVCEPGVGHTLASTRIDARRSFVDCRRQVAWDDVDEVHVMGGVVERPLASCGGRAIQLADIVVTFAHPGPRGKAYTRFELEDAVSVRDRYYLAGKLRCEEVPEGYTACRDIVRRTTERTVHEIGTRALELEAGLMLGCESLTPDRRSQLSACVDTARDTSALDACYRRAYALPEADDGADGELGALPPSCLRFLAAYERCVEAMPESARAPARAGLSQMRAAWAGAASQGLESACQAALDASRESLSGICPDAWSDAPAEP